MNLDTKRIDAIFAEWDRDDSPGCSLGIYKDGEIAYAQGYGMSNLEHGIPIAPDSIFHVASVSKHFATFCIGLLEEEGKLSADDHVRKYVPRLPDFGHSITIRHLIHHTSGIRDQWELLHYAGWRQEDLVNEEDVMVLLERQQALNFEPGEKYLYSNSGYTLLAVIIKEVTGKTIREFAHERIFEPLNMTRTHFHMDHREIVLGRTQAYLPRDGGGYEISIPEFALSGATSLFTTVEDLAKWERNFAVAQVGSPELIAKMQLRGTLRTGEEIDYGWALSNRTYRGAKIVEHAGADHGYRAHFLRLPEYGIAVSCLANLSRISPGMLCDRVVDVLLDGKLEAKAESEIAPATPIANPAATDFIGTFREAKEGMLMHIGQDGDRLILDFDEPRELIAAGDSGERKTGGPWPLTITPVTAGDSAPAGVTASIGFSPTPIRFDRIEPATYSPAQLSEFAGRYWSDELRCFYDVALDGESLAIDRFKHARRQLHPAGSDNFFHGLIFRALNLTFEREPSGAIIGFIHSSGRINGLRFRRVPDGTP